MTISAISLSFLRDCEIENIPRFSRIFRASQDDSVYFQGFVDNGILFKLFHCLSECLPDSFASETVK